MLGLIDAKGPSYISSHSADVILSDIRPTKLKPDALRVINVFLDEFLYKILSISSSLGKEALLEAEVELRAYWERTDSRTSVEDDSRTFHLQWAFELLRLKCEAYSTLNEQDEVPNLEGRVSEKLGKPHLHPPKVLVDPAALYLTAILESICEHILSNVGRVVARDSSRTNATVNDLFVALCEDDSIYGLFKTMKVYEQIEIMTKGPSPQRTKSFTRNDPPRTSSPHQELTRANSSSGSRSRQSLDRQSATNPSGSGSGTSFEKSRAIRMFVNSKVSIERDGDSQLGHKKSESLRSETSRQPSADDDIPNIVEDADMLREFDDLMRSTSTMKVSLTPDRLRSMEMYKQEKDQRDTKRGPPHFSLSKPGIPPTSQPHTKKPSSHQVDSIIEDEDENNPPQTRARQSSIASQPTSSFAAVIPGRIRSVSTSGAGILSKKVVRSPSVQAAPSSFSRNMPLTKMVQSRDMQKASDNGLPARTRNRQRRRDSLDLDCVMNGSDDDGDQGSILRNQNLSPPATPRIVRAQYPVSAHTRDLIEFLAEGPPEPKVSKSGAELLDFLAQGPPEYGGSTVSLDPSKPKGAGRLQRMISKLSIGGEKAKVGYDVSGTPSLKQPTTPVRSTISHKTSATTLSSLANRPIPPRPRPISPPPSPQYSYDEDKSIRSPPRNSHPDTLPPRETPLIERAAVAKPVAVTKEKPIHIVTSHVNGNARNGKSPNEASSEPQPFSPARTIPRKAIPATDSPSTPFFTETDAKDMQRLFTNATTVDECRLILDMFMARNGLAKRSEADVPYPSPSPSVIKHAPLVHNSDGEASIESTLVEFFLGGTAMPDVIFRVPPERSQCDAPIEVLPVATEALVDVKLVANSDSPPVRPPSLSQSSPLAP